MNRHRAIRLAAASAVFISVAAAANNTLIGQQGEGARFEGAYSFSVPLGPGLTFRGLAVVHTDGTSTFSDVSDFGGPGGPIGPTLNSPGYGTWTRVAPRTLRVVWIRFLHDVATGVVTHVLRATAVAEFDARNADFAAGTFTEEVYPCAGPLACPEPATLPDVTPQASLPFTAVRLRSAGL